MVTGREALAAREAGLGQQGSGGVGVVDRHEVALAPARDAGRDHRGGDRRRDRPRPGGAIRRQSTAAANAWRTRTSSNGGSAGVEAVVLGRQRRDLAQLRPEAAVVGDPGGIELADRRVVEVAVLERLDGAPAAEVGDELDRCAIAGGPAQ